MQVRQLSAIFFVYFHTFLKMPTQRLRCFLYKYMLTIAASVLCLDILVWDSSMFNILSWRRALDIEASISMLDIEAYQDYWNSASGYYRLSPEPPACLFTSNDSQSRREEWTDTCTCEQLKAWNESPARAAFLGEQRDARCIRRPPLLASMFSFCSTSYFIVNKTAIDDAMFLHVHQWLRKHRVPYVPRDGSLIGLARHGGTIPWDDDRDIFVEFAAKARALRALGELFGTELRTKHGVAKFDGFWSPKWSEQGRLGLPAGKSADMTSLTWKYVAPMCRTGPQASEAMPCNSTVAQYVGGSVEIYFDLQMFFKTQPKWLLTNKRDTWWPPGLAPFGASFAFAPRWPVLAPSLKGGDRYVAPLAGDHWAFEWGDVMKTCSVSRHYDNFATAQFEGNLGGPTARPCDDLKPYFEFATRTPVACGAAASHTPGGRLRVGARSNKDVLSRGWEWACTAGASVTLTSVDVGDSNVYTAAVVAFPNRCSIAVRTPSRCVEPAECTFPSFGD